MSKESSRRMEVVAVKVVGGKEEKTGGMPSCWAMDDAGVRLRLE